jgi:hypothetical protein
MIPHHYPRAASDSEWQVIVAGGAKRFGGCVRARMDFPRSVDRELPVGDQLLNAAMVTRDNVSTGIFRVFLGVTSRPGHNSFLTFRILVFAITVVRHYSATQTHTKETL